jgi:dTDP-4-amino-4,6-dideoxygalactose transaminase
MVKTSPADLAILGGPPAFAEPIHVGRPNVGDADTLTRHVRDLISTRRLSNNGPKVQQFERRLLDWLGGQSCVAVANGTLGLMLASQALRLWGEVILPSFTFIGTAHSLAWQGLTPVFCDIDPDTYLISPEQVEALITPRTSAILAVHLFGRTCDIDALEEIAWRHGLKLIFDAAHAFGCSYRGGPIADRGDASIFSFHATKVVNAGEGGVVTTPHPDVARALSRMRNFGFRDYDEVDGLGINAKMSELSAAMGLTSLDGADEFIVANRRNFDCYRRLLDPIPGITMLPVDESETNNYHYVVIDVDPEEAGVSRDVLLRVLHAENILARRYFHPGCHRMEPYVSTPPWQGTHLPHTERMASRILTLPTGTAVGEAEIEAVCVVLGLAVGSASLLPVAAFPA